MPASTVSTSSFLSRFTNKSSASTAGKMYKCTIQMLDDSETFTIEFKKHETGQELLDKVCEHAQLIEKDYFGLRFMDVNKHRYWLDPLKPIFKQIHGANAIVFCLRVRFYPADVRVVKDELTRYFIFLQLRRDLLHGRLYCPQSEAAHLGAYILQSEIGDFDAAEHADAYVSEYKLFLKQTAKLEDRIAEVHRTLQGQVPAEAEQNFIERASHLDTYGFDPYTVKDNKTGNQVYLGMTHIGILVYQLNRKLHQITWSQVEKVDYFGKEFRIYPSVEYAKVEEALDGVLQKTATVKSMKSSSPLKSTALKFTCPSATFAKHLWKHALAQKAFFTADQSANLKPIKSKARVPIFARGSTFRYSGRVLHEIAEEVNSADKPKREMVNFVRYPPERQPGRDDRTYPWIKEQKENGLDSQTKYATLPRAQKPSRHDDTTDQRDGTKSALDDTPTELHIASDFEDSPVIDWTPADSRAEVSGSPPPGLIANSATYDSQLSAETPQTSLSQPSTSTPTSAPVEKKVTFAPNNVVEAKQNGSATRCAPVRLEAASGAPSALVRLLINMLFVGTILIIVGIVLMETRNSTVQHYVHQVPYHHQFRHLYYDPLREKTLDIYGRLFGKKQTGGGGWL